jgi:hypothetical protein
LALLPTPIASDARDHYKTETYKADNLSAQIKLLPTPTTQDGSNNAGLSQFRRNTMPLNTLVTTLETNENQQHLLATPCASDSNETPQAGDSTKASSPEELPVKRLEQGTHQLYLTDVVQGTLQQGSDSTQMP